jgi:hypothetical protein
MNTLDYELLLIMLKLLLKNFVHFLMLVMTSVPVFAFTLDLSIEQGCSSVVET